MKFKQVETLPQFSVDYFLQHEATPNTGELNAWSKTNTTSPESLILQFNSQSNIKSIETYVSQLIHDKDFKKIWHIANLMKKHRILPSNELYTLLLKACSLTKKPEATSLAVKLYYELITLHDSKLGDRRITRDIYNNSAYFLLMSFQFCNDFTELLSLKIIWENYIIHYVDKPIYELLYHSAYINTLLNTCQIQMAIEHFEKAFHLLTEIDILGKYHQFAKYDVLVSLPTIRILDIMSSNKDCDKLQNWLQIISEEKCMKIQSDVNYTKEILSDNNWLKYLNTGLLNNNYGLVKCIYDNFIMKDFSEGITAESILFQRESATVVGNVILDSINDETIFQILHTFAINGDVNLTLSLIESHYIHKTMKGEKALTKELCLKIIESYCFHPNLQSNWNEDELLKMNDFNDESIKIILDVLNNFVLKFSKDYPNNISYRDITDAISFKFVNYKVNDENIRKAKMKQFEISEKIKNPEDFDKVPGLPRKVSNTNLETSHGGNVLANLETLRKFISKHLAYLIDEKKYPKFTITLFINCILNHINLYQNFSGTVKALSSIYRVNSNMVSDFLDADLFDIILNSLSNSNSAKISSLVIFNYMRSMQKLTHDHYRCFISAILRGDFHESLQYFLYNYLKDYNGVIDPKILQLLQELPMDIVGSNASTVSLLSFVEEKTIVKSSIDSNVFPLTSQEIDEFWKSKALCLREPVITDSNLIGFKRFYNHSYDVRDSQYLSYMFNGIAHGNGTVSIQ